jgi:hypothetical protein
MPIPQPPVVLRGHQGTLTVGGVRYGVLSDWRIVVSPTTQRYTLLADGVMQRFLGQAIGARAHAHLIPAPIPARIGRPRPPVRPPCTLIGTLVRVTPTAITIAEADFLPG